MKSLFSLVAILVFSLPAFAQKVEPIHCLFAGRVIGQVQKEEGWSVSIGLMKDRNNPDAWGYRFKIGDQKLFLNGTEWKAGEAISPDGEFHTEIMQWYALNEPCGVVEKKDGSIDIVPLKGRQKEDWLKVIVDGTGRKRGTSIADQFKNPSLAEVREIRKNYFAKNPLKPVDPRNLPITPARKWD